MQNFQFSELAKPLIHKLITDRLITEMASPQPLLPSLRSLAVEFVLILLLKLLRNDDDDDGDDNHPSC